MLKKINHPLVGNFISLLLLQGVNYVLPLVTVPYLFRTLNVEKYGLINFSAAFIQYFIVFTDFGYNLSATKLIAEAKDDEAMRSRIFSRIMASKLLLLLVGIIFLLIIITVSDKFGSDKLVYIFSFGMVVGNTLFPVWFFMGMEKMKFITAITIVTRVLSVAPIFLFVTTSNDYLLVPVINSTGAVISGIAGLVIAKRIFKISFYLPSFKEITESLKDSSQYFVSRVSVSLYTISNSFTLGLFGSNTIVGYYAAAEKLFTALQSAYVPVNNSIYPYMAKTKNVTLFKKIFWGITVLNSAGILILLFQTEEVLRLIYKTTETPSADALRILLVACIIIVPSILLGYPLLGTLGYTKAANRSVIMSSVLHLLGLGFLVVSGSLSLVTVSYMVLITESVVFLLRVYAVRKYKLFNLENHFTTPAQRVTS
ncbi:oligosaccharide flippase family protein [Foetidibacter luteolus]|uniref:oligosaccharide flippase family protein n=1 Tax=Foetidibacter luteolus TaxID=2608880 RepID=UPI00129BA52A|nr:oligosaccharide flippase family protein [Foetidibacter luteolus]